MPYPYSHSNLPHRTIAAALGCTLALSAFPCSAQAKPTSQEIAQEREALEAEFAEAQSQLDRRNGRRRFWKERRTKGDEDGGGVVRTVTGRTSGSVSVVLLCVGVYPLVFNVWTNNF